MFLCTSVCFCVFLCISECFCVFSKVPLSYQMPHKLHLHIFVTQQDMLFCVFLCASVCFCVFLYASVYLPGFHCHVRYFSYRTSCTWILSQPDDAPCAFCTSQIYQMWTQIYQPWSSHFSNSKFFPSIIMHDSF